MNENKEIIVKPKTSKVVIALLIILIIMVICLSGYIVYDKVIAKDDIKTNEKIKNNIEENNNNEEEKIVARDLTKYELDSFLKFFNEEGINQIVTSRFNSAKELDLLWVLYSLDNDNILTEDEKNEYLKASGFEEIYTNVDILKKEDVSKFLKTYTGYDINDFDLSDGFKKSYIYLAKYDSYYHMHGDTNMQSFNKIDSGLINDKGQYVITITLQDGTNEIILEKNADETYKFISNVCKSNCQNN